MHLAIIILLTNEKFVKKKLLEKIINGLFFNVLISITLESLVEFLVYSILNFYTYDFSINGEILGFCISLFCTFCIIFVFLALLWTISKKNKSQLKEEKFLNRWGALIEFININKKTALLYNIIYVIRRFIYVIICFYKNESQGLILVMLFVSNLLFGIIILSLKGFKDRRLNHQDLMGEIVVAFTLEWKIVYTAAVDNQEIQ